MDRRRPRRDCSTEMRIAASSSCSFLCVATTLLLACRQMTCSHAFVVPNTLLKQSGTTRLAPPFASASPSALNVWWFGGTDEKTESGLMDDSPDSCELVAVRIDRTSPNSRRIAGDITVNAPLQDVWAILCDYDHLATHVPNLVESRRVSGTRGGSSATTSPLMGSPGDGQYRCRLYQKGAQKIVGFEFGASVTMDMKEQIVVPPNSHNFPDVEEHAFFPQERRVLFKCVESPFFSEFDGEWRVVEHRGANGEIETVVSYEVEVRPRGPVPVMALEWRIREDVPTNLRAVKHAALTVGAAGVEERKMRSRAPPRAMPSSTAAPKTNMSGTAVPEPVSRQVRRVQSAKSQSTQQQGAPRELTRIAARSQLTPLGQSKLNTSPAAVAGGDWFDDETMAAYLKNDQ